MDKPKEERLRELFASVKGETEEILFILGHTPGADMGLVAAFDKILRLLSDE